MRPIAEVILLSTLPFSQQEHCKEFYCFGSALLFLRKSKLINNYVLLISAMDWWESVYMYYTLRFVSYNDGIVNEGLSV